MKFQIRNNKGTIEIVGNFTTAYASAVQEYFDYLLDHYEEVVMCVKQVHTMDKKAAKVLSSIYEKAKKRNKILFVLGKKNTAIRQAFQQYKITHIFRNDY